MSLREDIIDVLGDTCCFVIAALLFPDMEPDPAIVAEAKRSNVHVIWGTDNLMNRLAAIAARKAYYPPNADDIRREVAASPTGRSPTPGKSRPRAIGKRSTGTRTAGGPGVSQAGNPGRRHLHRPRGHPDCPHRVRQGEGRSQVPGTRGASPDSGTPRDLGRSSSRDDRPSSDPPESRCSGRSNFTIQQTRTFRRNRHDPTG